MSHYTNMADTREQISTEHCNSFFIWSYIFFFVSITSTIAKTAAVTITHKNKIYKKIKHNFFQRNQITLQNNKVSVAHFRISVHYIHTHTLPLYCFCTQQNAYHAQSDVLSLLQISTIVWYTDTGFLQSDFIMIYDTKMCAFCLDMQ